MAQVKTSFFCQNCGTQHSKWQGQCYSCKQWNTLAEEIIEKKNTPAWEFSKQKVDKKNKPLPLKDIDTEAETRIKVKDSELNRVLGSGIVPGSIILLSGEPGIGKSTLLLQLAIETPKKVLYVSGEESQKQIKLRAQRISVENNPCYIMSETKIESIFKHIIEIQPEILIIDSIQTLYTQDIESGAGSISQIKTCTTKLIEFAKKTDLPIFIIGHITKDGQIAGPKILEHMVDTVLQFEGDTNHVYRILRAQKNRFGATSEVGIYEMTEKGLEVVENPNRLLISAKDSSLSGHAIGATLEGIRVLMVEMQALVSLEKRTQFKLGSKDVFFNITGGMTLEDPAIDLAVIAAILSSNYDIPIKDGICFASEVGLSGELRAVSRIEQRIQEAEKIGFKSIVISKFNKLNFPKLKIKVIALSKVEEVAAFLFS